MSRGELTKGQNGHLPDIRVYSQCGARGAVFRDIGIKLWRKGFVRGVFFRLRLRVFWHLRVFAPAIPTGFHGTQSATYLGNPTTDPYQTFRTCRPRDPLLYFGPLSSLRFPVSPLGGDKGFSLTLNISLIFKNIPDIFISLNRPR